MARAIWKGSIAFGLVNIPIELHTAIRNHRPKFRMLHAKDKSPVKIAKFILQQAGGKGRAAAPKRAAKKGGARKRSRHAA